VGITLPLALVLGGLLGNGVALLVIVVAAVVGWVLVPGFWRTFGVGLRAGGIAGALMLGPGFRLAMRVVAILDIRRVEFTLGGTFFIILGVGVIFGGMVGIAAVFLRTGLAWSGWVTTGLMTASIMGLLLVDTGLRSEFVELGAGPWMNIPMFATVTVGYGLATNRLIDRFKARSSGREAREPVEVPT